MAPGILLGWPRPVLRVPRNDPQARSLVPSDRLRWPRPADRARAADPALDHRRGRGQAHPAQAHRTGGRAAARQDQRQLPHDDGGVAAHARGRGDHAGQLRAVRPRAPLPGLRRRPDRQNQRAAVGGVLRRAPSLPQSLQRPAADRAPRRGSARVPDDEAPARPRTPTHGRLPAPRLRRDRPHGHRVPTPRLPATVGGHNRGRRRRWPRSGTPRTASTPWTR
jgi:hypothetical protein